MHSVIENACKKTDIYNPHDYFRIVEMARRHGDPYVVKQMAMEDFADYGMVADSYVKNRTKDVTGSKVKWLHIKCLQYNKNSPDSIFFVIAITASILRFVLTKGLEVVDVVHVHFHTYLNCIQCHYQ